MPTITDPEFGEITVTRRALASRVSLRIAPNGRIRITMWLPPNSSSNSHAATSTNSSPNSKVIFHTVHLNKLAKVTTY